MLEMLVALLHAGPFQGLDDGKACVMLIVLLYAGPEAQAALQPTRQWQCLLRWPGNQWTLLAATWAHSARS